MDGCMVYIYIYKYYDPITPICAVYVVYISFAHVVVVVAMIPNFQIVAQSSQCTL